MTDETWFRDLLAEYKDDPDFLTEQLLLDVTEQIYRRMRDCGLRSSDLAQRLGVSRAFVSQLLNGKPNMTMRTLVSVARALDERVHVILYPKSVQESAQRMLLSGGAEPVPVAVPEDPHAVAIAA